MAVPSVLYQVSDICSHFGLIAFCDGGMPTLTLLLVLPVLERLEEALTSQARNLSAQQFLNGLVADLVKGGRALPHV